MQLEKDESAEYLSTIEISKKKGFTPSFIKKACKVYGLPHYRFGRLLKFKEKEFDQWADERQKKIG